MESREIRFRFYDAHRKLMFYEPIIYDGKFFENGRMFEDNTPCNYPLMQFTGLKDSRGVDIYESDIVAIGNMKLTVVFDRCGFELTHLLNDNQKGKL